MLRIAVPKCVKFRLLQSSLCVTIICVGTWARDNNFEPSNDPSNCFSSSEELSYDAVI
jgi:hypothetical protein